MKYAEVVILVSLAIVFMVMAVAYLLTVAPRIFDSQWDILAFSGSIIGGYITWGGIKVTLKHQEHSVFVKSFNEQIKILIPITNQLKFIISTEMMLARSINNSTPETMTYKLNQLEKFHNILNKGIESMIGVVDYSFIKRVNIFNTAFLKISILKRKLDRLDLSDEELEKTNQELEDLDVVARTVYGKITNYKSKLEKDYEQRQSKRASLTRFFTW